MKALAAIAVVLVLLGWASTANAKPVESVETVKLTQAEQTHAVSFPHWRWWRNDDGELVKRKMRQMPTPLRPCTPDNEGEVVDVWDAYFKGFASFRCQCFESFCTWVEINRYGWSFNPLFDCWFACYNRGPVRDAHRLCAALPCRTVWDRHGYYRRYNLP